LPVPVNFTESTGNCMDLKEPASAVGILLVLSFLQLAKKETRRRMIIALVFMQFFNYRQ